MNNNQKAIRNGIIGILLIVILKFTIIASLGFPMMAVAQSKKSFTEFLNRNLYIQVSFTIFVKL